MRRIIVPIAVALLAAACSGDASPPGSTATIPTDDGTVAQTTSSTTATPETTDTEVTLEPTTTITLPRTRNAGRRGSSGFRSLDDPQMITIEQATWIEPDDVVLGIVAPNGEAHAFPVNQMTFHHIANTTLAGEPYLVTY